MKKKLIALALLTATTASFAAPISTPNNVSDTPIISSSNNSSCRTVDLTNATSDYKLQPCETAVIKFSNATSVPLHIATDPDALYWLYSPSCAHLLPNNINYSNAFRCTDWGMNWDGGSVSGGIAIGSPTSAFALGNCSGTGTAISYIDLLNAKTITQHAAVFQNPFYPYSIRHYACHWNSPVSWTSLGTLQFLRTTSGYVLVKRLH
jgi:hypothetical protein